MLLSSARYSIHIPNSIYCRLVYSDSPIPLRDSSLGLFSFGGLFIVHVASLGLQHYRQLLYTYVVTCVVVNMAEIAVDMPSLRLLLQSPCTNVLCSVFVLLTTRNRPLVNSMTLYATVDRAKSHLVSRPFFSDDSFGCFDHILLLPPPPCLGWDPCSPATPPSRHHRRRFHISFGSLLRSIIRRMSMATGGAWSLKLLRFRRSTHNVHAKPSSRSDSIHEREGYELVAIRSVAVYGTGD
ncbi:hypothetical protein C8Q79DRAFT_982753 [Trametes meyenii]|nr:hypothetical protein C8Q79DRAFT_982753 [Trametes meyenii]